MRLLLYVRGTIGLAKDAARLFFRLLARPHYVAMLLGATVGAFALAGIGPRDIPSFVGEKWNAVVADRKKVLQEDLRRLSDYIDARRGTKTASAKRSQKREKNAPPPFFSPRRAEPEIVIGDDGTIAVTDAADRSETAAEPPRPTADYFISAVASESAAPEQNGDFIKGRLIIVGAAKVRVNGRDFVLPVKIRAGRAGDAFAELKRRYDGAEGRCYPAADNAENAECFVGAVGLGETLVDFGYAENL